MIGGIIIVVACFLGIRYVGSVIHYSCADPRNDGPPPICLSAELGWIITGGSLIPLWTRD